MYQNQVRPLIDDDDMSDQGYDDLESQSQSSSDSEGLDEDDQGPATETVVGSLRKGDFVPSAAPGGKADHLFDPIKILGARDAAETIRKAKGAKSKSAPLLRRLRVYDSKRANAKRKLQAQTAEQQDDVPQAKLPKLYNTHEPECIRESDDAALDTHPVLIFLREHTPVRPCGRCHECRKPPCNVCTNCKNNQHLTERSRDRKRCIAHGCSKLTDDELAKYRMAYAEEDKMAQIERELRELRDKLMLEEKANDQLEQEQKKLLEALKTLQEKHVAMEAEVPDGYECLLLSIQTMETERDRIARLVKRRTNRDSPEVMRTRRQLRNYYGRAICDLVRKFVTDMISRPHVQELIDIANAYEEHVTTSNKQISMLPI
jgi:hypothetical protein